MNEENVANRLKVFMSEIGLGSSQFADACGIPRPSVSQIISGRNKKINNEILGKIHEGYPNLSISWLLFGEGEMIDGASAGAASIPSDDASFSSPSDGNVGTSGSGAASSSDFGRVSDAENPEFPANRTGVVGFSGENGLEGPKNSGQIPVTKDLNYTLRIHDLESQIANLKKNPRRVTQITIYYDDSTFETFIPAPTSLS